MVDPGHMIIQAGMQGRESTPYKIMVEYNERRNAGEDVFIWHDLDDGLLLVGPMIWTMTSAADRGYQPWDRLHPKLNPDYGWCGSCKHWSGNGQAPEAPFSVERHKCWAKKVDTSWIMSCRDEYQCRATWSMMEPDPPVVIVLSARDPSDLMDVAIGTRRIPLEEEAMSAVERNPGIVEAWEARAAVARAKSAGKPVLVLAPEEESVDGRTEH